MNQFVQRSVQEPWFTKARDYLVARRSVVQQRLQSTFRFVELSTKNGSTFSYEFASILRDAGSVFGSVLDSLVKGKRGDFDLRTDFGDYRSLLTEEDPDIHRRSLQVRGLFPRGVLVPLSALSSRNQTPTWWQAYNNVKHSEYDNFREGNLKNAVLSVAALVVLEHVMGVHLADNLWVNIGIAYQDGSIDMSNERCLFHDTSTEEAS